VHPEYVSGMCLGKS